MQRYKHLQSPFNSSMPVFQVFTCILVDAWLIHSHVNFAGYLFIFSALYLQAKYSKIHSTWKKIKIAQIEEALKRQILRHTKFSSNIKSKL